MSRPYFAACMIIFAAGLLVSAIGCAGGSAILEMSPEQETSARAELGKAHALFAKAEYPAARRIYRELSNGKVYSRSIAAEALFYQAECLFNEKDYVAARWMYRDLLKEHRQTEFFDSAIRREFLIGAAFITGRTSTFWRGRGFGAQVLEDALKDAPYGDHAPEARLYLADYYMSKRRWEDAMRQSDLLIRHYPYAKEAAARFTLAMAAYNAMLGNRLDPSEIGKVSRYLEDARRAISALPDSDLRTSRLQTIYEKIADLNETAARESYDLGMFFMRNGNLAGAMASFEHVLEVAPESSYGRRAQKEISAIIRELEP